jgi:hypothetical protein
LMYEIAIKNIKKTVANTKVSIGKQYLL